MAKKRPQRKAPKKSSKKNQEVAGATRTKMRVIGIGGGGGNIVSEISQRLKKADFVAANTDLQALKNVSRSMRTFAFGQKTTRGLGCGMDPDVALSAALEDKERVRHLVQGQDLTLFVASLGGGTGSGAAPLFAQFSQEAKNLSIGIFTLPFAFEGEKRRQLAQNALEKLKGLVNVYVVIPNDAIFNIVEKDVPLRVALSSVNKKLAESLEGFIETLYLPGLINVDFADLKALLLGKGRLSYLSSSTCSGEDRAKLALDQVLANPLYEYSTKGAERLLFTITGSKDLKMQEVAHISKGIGEQNSRAKIVFGISTNPKLHNKLRITVLAVGCEQKPSQGQKAKALLNTQKKEEKKEKQPRLIQKKKQAPKKNEKKKKPPRNQGELGDKPRRNALDVKKALDETIQELQKEEQKWDAPAFLRFRRT